ncbi:putative small Rab GTP binding protein [Leptomonas pyrrhocoris]|uniref:Putative small Rab GTP binding protein n=1 Tax=Leptomonas pyrrhocoris TaxID=157538 RepID=A0A0M9FUV0_LEPPY|nr:putative small Rab GTP binding protein [Leptomonas pyrrhocoris]KPA76550.1 putative small Rab GTP binding protein [Leptomonas pyrrhocoris]|eukprot:XP_015654989.1 putative small Rab GTP binding protein [Leptomonas pyrrhocoris]
MSSISRSSAAASAKKYKLVLLGESGVGKSSVVQRLMKNAFSESINSTVGASFFRYTCNVGEDTVVYFDIWDTAGQERFKSLASMYYRGAAAAMVVFEINLADTFEKAKFWVRELHVNSPETLVVLVGNKKDLESERQVSLADAQRGAAEMNALYVETSARSGEGVQEAFQTVAQKLAETNSTAIVREGGVVGQAESATPRRRDGGCC